MSSDPRVSIVLPVFNVERFLDQCLSSICDQTYPSFEAICINDGSTDTSLAILQEYAARDERFIIVDKQNEGYGASCNKGLSLARGEYVAIVEPDDYLEPAMLKEMLDFADSFAADIDIVKAAWFDVVEWDDPDTLRSVPSRLYRRIPSSTQPQSLESLPALIEGHPSIWSALYRKAFLDEQGIRFKEYPGAGWADNPFLIESLGKARTIAYLDSMYYHYRNDLPLKAKKPATEDAISLPFERWAEMTDSLERLGIDDRVVLSAHYLRGFNYIDGAIIDFGWENPLVQAKAKDLLSRMDRRLVLDHKKLSPQKKTFYLEQTGQPHERVSRIPYCRHLARELILYIKARGLKGALGEIARFARTKTTGIGIEETTPSQ